MFSRYELADRKDKTSEAAIKILQEFMHDICIDDNASNRQAASVQIGIDARGAPVFAEHPPLYYPGSWPRMHDILTGRDSTQPKGVDGEHPRVASPHAAWVKLMALPGKRLKCVPRVSAPACPHPRVAPFGCLAWLLILHRMHVHMPRTTTAALAPCCPCP